MNPTQTAPSAHNALSETPDINMRPVTVLLGIIMGTVGSVASGLLLVCLIFWMLADEYPRLNAEIPVLVIATIMFSGLSVCAGLSFYGALKSRSWRHYPMAALWLGIAIVGWYFWPA